MEYCGVFYGAGSLPSMYCKVRNLFFVFLTAVLLPAGMMVYGVGTVGVGVPVTQSDTAREIAVAEKIVETGRTGDVLLRTAEILLPADTPFSVLQSSKVSADYSTVASDRLLVSDERGSSLSLTEETGMADRMSAEVILPDDSVIHEEDEEILLAEGTVTGDSPSEKESFGNKTVVGDGFLVDESGMICGISDSAVVSEDGYLTIPSKGCKGIAAGAFSSCKSEVTEIYIPANITEIETGAFAGLPSLGWIEMETSAGYYTEDGVLFSDEGTCLLAFPPARTGNYKVPSGVTKIAEGAFDHAGISVLDASSCLALDAGSMPKYIELRQ